MKSLFFILFCLLLSSLNFAQSPGKFHYQGVARDQGGKVITDSIGLRLSFLEEGVNGLPRYIETQRVQPNPQGVFSLTIGKGKVVSGDIDLIAFEDYDYWLKVEMKGPGDVNFTEMGTTQLLSVPYAKYAEKAGTILEEGQGIGITNNIITNLGDLSDQNELQSLSMNGNQLSISQGNTITLPTGTTYSEGAGIDINGNTISAIDPSLTNEIQTLSINGQQLSLSNGGGSVQLPAGSAGAWTTNGNVTSSTPTSNSVAIGTTNNSGAKLNVSSTGTEHGGNFYAPGIGDAVHAYNNSTGAGVSGSSLNGRGGQFTSVGGDGGYFSSTSGHAIITGSGNVGIGITTPTRKLDVKGTARFDPDGTGATTATLSSYGYDGKNALYAVAYDGGDAAYCSTDGGHSLVVRDLTGGEGTGILFSAGATDWEMYLDEFKDINFAYEGLLKAWIYDNDGSYHNSSDSRLKKDIEPFTQVLPGLTKLQAYTYRMKDAPENSPISVGFMAQDVEAQFPQLVAEKNGYKSLCYDHFAVMSVQAIREQQVEIEDLKSKIERLEKLVEVLVNR